MSSGIYYIINKINNTKYIGSSKNIEKRFKQHKMKLRNLKHHSVFLQRSYNKHGLENFEFCIVEETYQLFEREQFHINLHDKKHLYNVGSVGGGDNFTNNPNKTQIIEKMSQGSKKMWDNRTPEERDKLRMSGDNNPNYGNKWTREMKNKNSELAKKRYQNNPELIEKMRENSSAQWLAMSPEDKNKFKDKCRERMLKNNPFKGKKHSQETLDRMSTKRKETFINSTAEERYNRHSQTRMVLVDGELYYGLSEAGRQLGLSPALMLYRLKSTSEKWKHYQYAPIENHSENGNDILG